MKMLQSARHSLDIRQDQHLSFVARTLHDRGHQPSDDVIFSTAARGNRFQASRGKSAGVVANRQTIDPTNASRIVPIFPLLEIMEELVLPH